MQRVFGDCTRPSGDSPSCELPAFHTPLASFCLGTTNTLRHARLPPFIAPPEARHPRGVPVQYSGFEGFTVEFPWSEQGRAGRAGSVLSLEASRGATCLGSASPRSCAHAKAITRSNLAIFPVRPGRRLHRPSGCQGLQCIWYLRRHQLLDAQREPWPQLLRCFGHVPVGRPAMLGSTKSDWSAA